MQNVPQTGLIVKDIAPTDWVMGSDKRIPPVELLPSGDWTPYLPSYEKQSIPFTFDTFSCTTFMSLNCLEIKANLLRELGYFTELQMRWLIENGYIDTFGSFNFSDRFTAIMSGTKIYGNDFVSVMNSIRNDGCLPERDFPFGGTTWDQYHNKTLITPAMKAKAQRFREVVEVTYEWISFTTDGKFTMDIEDLYNEALKRSPVGIGIKFPATHAITMYVNKSTSSMLFDHYEPYTYKYKHSSPIHFGMRSHISVLPEAWFVIFKNTLRRGIKGEQVKRLQDLLGILVDGDFGPATEKAVIDFQKANNLKADGVAGPLTLAEVVKKKS